MRKVIVVYGYKRYKESEIKYQSLAHVIYLLGGCDAFSKRHQREQTSGWDEL